ncbi:hypothetical protein ACFSM5_19890 [Lacibacterium aquatile]|uniref:Uncharacterized protein n=1 Tax=Lacibacterium aquatile TaxID=1168082 RepID=A0ABW5DWD8_9PROT
MRFVPAFALLFAATPALASSPDAWAAFAGEVKAACVAASELKDAKPASSQLLFPGTHQQVAMLVTGIYPQPHMKGKAGTVLCLYDQKSATAQISEAEGWAAVQP